jgi:hypothetical protein
LAGQRLGVFAERRGGIMSRIRQREPAKHAKKTRKIDEHYTPNVGTPIRRHRAPKSLPAGKLVRGPRSHVRPAGALAMMAVTVAMAIGQNSDNGGSRGHGKLPYELDELLHMSRRMRTVARYEGTEV